MEAGRARSAPPSGGSAPVLQLAVPPAQGGQGAPNDQGEGELQVRGEGQMEVRPTSPSTAGIWGPQAHTLGPCEPPAPRGHRHFLGTWWKGGAGLRFVR